ncbi:hypothetical protein [Nocardioides zeicaulis]|uniref:Uncharacterized protein n=1 Tax=Nocardioides zeicaulis TaxID=1776857 RepID=A0ABV6DWT7_9ACTN
MSDPRRVAVWNEVSVVGTIFIVLFVGFCFWAAYATSRPEFKQQQAELNAQKEAARRAEIEKEVKKLFLKGPDWMLKVASRDKVNVVAGRRAVTAVTLTNFAGGPAMFEVSMILADADSVRVGTVSTLSATLADREQELLTLQGPISPMTTKTFGRIDYQVRRIR